MTRLPYLSLSMQCDSSKPRPRECPRFEAVSIGSLDAGSSLPNLDVGGCLSLGGPGGPGGAVVLTESYG